MMSFEATDRGYRFCPKNRNEALDNFGLLLVGQRKDDLRRVVGVTKLPIKLIGRSSLGQRARGVVFHKQEKCDAVGIWACNMKGSRHDHP